jgi:hypothetical protein
MKSRILLAVIAGSLLPCMTSAQAPAGAPAGTTGKCKDGTYTSAASKQGACRGHQGVDTWYAAAPAKDAAAKVPKSAEAPAAKPAANSAAASASAPKAGSVPAGATGKCKDGTFTTAASKQGACRGHQGVDTWFAASAATPAPASTPKPSAAAPPSAAPAATPAPASAPTHAAASTPPKSSTADKTAAPGGGPGLVWVNTDSNVYHCYGTHWYGTTKAGKYMPESQATASGAKPDHGKPCSK